MNYIQIKWSFSECKKTNLCVLVGNIIFFKTVDQTFSILLVVKLGQPSMTGNNYRQSCHVHFKRSTTVN